MIGSSYLPNRFERKYVISEEKAAAIRALIHPHVEPDDYLTPEWPQGYPVYSLYLDSPQLALYNATAQGMKNRFKLRIRYYDDRPASPIFPEIKRRIDHVIRKQRVGIRRDCLGEVLRGVVPSSSELLSGVQGLGSLQDFCRLSRSLNAVPTLIVGYDREAYIDQITGTCRVTFDRNLRLRQFQEAEGLTTDLFPARYQDHGVILEMKYVDRLPPWMQRIILQFSLQRQSVPKYGWSVESLGEITVQRTASQRFTGRMGGLGRVVV
ncbi:MAG: polyphosphate polymerase domain-containing protein [Phycisphaerales bacterium]|nr:polyphosphate polymerase domain-containing protein [Planctomycetota bacterium]MCH8507258.1 polyphosphate polymerase domain-containing protein [Phycisphaerales bacterium]